MKAVKTRSILRVVIPIVIVVTVAIGIFFWANQNNTRNPQTITGRITAINSQCYVDGMCSVRVDNAKTIITGCGLGPEGKTCKTYDQSKLVTGQLIKAIVMQADAKTYNLECETCGIQALSE